MRGKKLLAVLVVLALLPVAFAQVKPRIFGAEAGDMVSGESTTLSTKIRNDGSQGTIEWWVECNDSEVKRGQEVLGAGELKEISVELTTSCAESTLYECSLYATGTGLAYNVHTDFEFRCRPPAICSAGEFKCEGMDLYECNRRGSEWLLSKTCVQGETCGKNASGVYACISSASANADSGSNNSPMSSMFDGYTIAVLILVGIIAVFAVLVYSKKKKLAFK